MKSKVFKCPRCKTKFQVTPVGITPKGKRVNCPMCGTFTSQWKRKGDRR